MRIFVSSTDTTGTRHNTRILLHNCSSTSQLTRQICRQFGIPRSLAIIKLKTESINLVVIDSWPLQHYSIRSGTKFTLETIQPFFKQSSQLNSPPEKTSQDPINQYLREGEKSPSYSNKNSKSTKIEEKRTELKYSQYLQQCLDRMLELVRNSLLEQISMLMKEQPPIQDQQELSELLKKKHQYLLNQNGDCGRNALHLAIQTQQPQIVSFLLIKGANTTRRTVDDYTPLQLAVQHHSPQIVDLLLSQHNFNINQNTQHGTALHLAIKKENIRSVEILLQHDASLDIQDGEGKLPIDVCKNQKIKSILLRKLQMGKLPPTNISTGPIYRVVSQLYLSKERILLINPFKSQFTLSTLAGQIDLKFSLSQVEGVQQIQQKSWLMSSQLFYFKVVMKNQQKDIWMAVRHQNILHRWLKHFRVALKYQEYQQYIKHYPNSQDTLEILDDEKGEIFQKSKISEKNPKNTNSIMNLKYQAEDKQISKHSSIKMTINIESTDCVSERNTLNQNQAMLRTQIAYQCVSETREKYTQQSITQSQFSDNIQRKLATNFKVNLLNPNQQIKPFRKNSDNRVNQQQYEPQEQRQGQIISYSDFQIIKSLGSGAFGNVYLARYNPSGQKYALKVLNKKKMLQKRHLKYAVGQANILKKLDCPFIVRLHYSFQTPNNLYMALDHCSLGDLSELIVSQQKLQQNTARFVIAQLILAIQYLHNLNVLYRDLKPQNIVIANDGYIQLTDFGLSRQQYFAISFCGSPAYLSPEMLQKKGVGKGSDIYGIGCVLYQMVVGEPPFFDEDIQVLFSNIRSGKLRFPTDLSADIKSLISRLLERDLKKRLGVQNINHIKSHSFFKNFDWQLLKAKRMFAPKEMFANFEQQGESAQIMLQVAQKITLVDRDYTEETRALNMVKNFNYTRDENEIRMKLPMRYRKETL